MLFQTFLIVSHFQTQVLLNQPYSIKIKFSSSIFVFPKFFTYFIKIQTFKRLQKQTRVIMKQHWAVIPALFEDAVDSLRAIVPTTTFSSGPDF